MITFRKELSTSQIYGSGLALILIFVLLYLFFDKPIFFYIVGGLTVALLIWPNPFRYFGIFWFALGDILGYVVGRILLTIIFLVVVVPVGLIMRGKLRSNLQLSQFKANGNSVFRERGYLFSGKDFSKPF